MNTTVIIIEMIVFAVLFTVLVFSAYSGGRQYSAAGIHNYPPEIQEEYFKTHERMEVSYKSGKVIATKGFGMILFTAIIAGCAYFAGAKTFLQGFLLAFFLMAWIGVYDTFFLDWVLFANLKMFRLLWDIHEDLVLLLDKSAGTSYENYGHEFALRMTDAYMEYYNEAKKRGLAKAKITRAEMHVLCSAFWTAIYEPFVHDMPWKEVEAHCKILSRYFNWAGAISME